MGLQHLDASGTATPHKRPPDTAAGSQQDHDCTLSLLPPASKASDDQTMQDATAATGAGAAALEQPTHQQWLCQRLASLHSCVWSSGVACVLLAAFIFAVAAVLVKLTAGRVPVLEITLIRSALSLVVSIGLIKLRGISPTMGHRQNIKWLIPRGIFGATAMTTFYGAILLLPLADGMTLFFINPCFTAVAAWAIRGEPLGLLGAAGVLCSLVGLVLLVHPPMIFGGHATWGAQRIWGTCFGLVSAVCCAGAFISIRYIGKKEPALVVALYFHLSTTIMSVLPLAASWPQAPVPLSWFDASLIVGVATGSFLGQLFMTRGLQLENASLMSSLNFSQVVYSHILGAVFLHEHLTLMGVLGSVLVALGMLGVTLKPRDAAGPQDAAAQAAARDAAGAGVASRPWGMGSAGSDSGSLGRTPSLSERILRLDSFKRLLQRHREAAATDGEGADGALVAGAAHPAGAAVGGAEQHLLAPAGNAAGSLPAPLLLQELASVGSAGLQPAGLLQPTQQQHQRQPLAASGAAAAAAAAAGAAARVGGADVRGHQLPLGPDACEAVHMQELEMEVEQQRLLAGMVPSGHAPGTQQGTGPSWQHAARGAVHVPVELSEATAHGVHHRHHIVALPYEHSNTQHPEPAQLR